MAKIKLTQGYTGHKHFWNAKSGGYFENGKDWFDLTNYGFKVRTVINGGESRYDYIEATLEKP